jgi:transcriptional adapter 2-beta
MKLGLTVLCLIVYYREFHDHMRAFTQFHTAQEHEQFLQNLQKERELKMRISELARYRRNGLTRHEECAHFEQERVQHEEWKEKRSVSYIFVTYYIRNACSL